MNRFLLGKIKKVIIFSRYYVSPEEICSLRERVILEENFHIGDSINKEDFERLYQKYGGMLSEEMFAEEILDVTYIGVKNMKKGGNSIILTNIDIPKEWVEQVRQRMIRENSFEQRNLLEREKIDKLYQKYGYILSKKQFINFILDTIDTRNKRITILRNEKTTDFDELRKRVIAESHLHYDEKMEYFRFKELHTKYAPNVREYIFAKEVLDMPKSAYDNIKAKKGEEFTHILLEEKLPDEEEIQKIKETVIKENKLHRKDKINYEKLKEYHLKYGGIMPEDMFAERILDVKKVSLKKIRPNQEQKKKQKETKILFNTEMPKEKIQELKRKIIGEKGLYNSKEISKQEFEEMYGNYEHILAESEFAKEILGVNNQSFNNLKKGTNKKVIIVIDTQERKRLTRQEILYEEIKILVDSGQTIKQIQKKTDLPKEEIKEIISKIRAERHDQEKEQIEKQGVQFFEKLEKNSKRILKGFVYSEKNIDSIRRYLDICEKLFENGKLEKPNLDLIEECIEFVQGGQEEIEFFAKLCISFREYQKANGFISRNIDNEGIKQAEKLKLRELQKNLNHAIKRETAVHMIYEQNMEDFREIAKITGLSEVEVLKIRKLKILNKKPNCQDEK